MAATSTAISSDLPGGPVLSLIEKRLRTLHKKLKRISYMEEKLANNKRLNKDEEEVYNSKTSVISAIDELNKLKQPLATAVAEEIKLAESDVVEGSESEEVGTMGDQDFVIGEVLKLVYFGTLFDVKRLSDFERVSSKGNHERECCLSCDHVSDEEVGNDLLGENDLDLILKLGSLVVSRPVDTGISHKDALEKCVEHAKLWLSGSDQPIEAGSNVTYALLKEKLAKIMASPYVTTTIMPEPVEVMTGNSGEGFDVQYQQKEESITHVVDYTVSDVMRIHPDLTVVRGKISCTGVNTDVSIVGFPGKMKADQHHKLASSHPFTISGLQLMYKAQNSIVVSIGHDCGTPLLDFVSKQDGDFWEYDSYGMYIRPAKVFRNLGKLVGGLLYRLHKGRICIGGSVMESIFVKGDGVQTPYYLTAMGPLTEYPKGTPGFSKAVWDDLNGFVSFVKFVEAKKSRKNPQKPHDLFDLTMFYSLLPIIENMPSSDDNVMKLSYFMCHTSLFWDYDERFAFCSCYYQLRKQGKQKKQVANTFDSLMDFQNYPQMDGWQKKVKRGVFRSVYGERKKLYDKKQGLVLLWRNLLVHCVKDLHKKSLHHQPSQATLSLKAADVDEQLIKLLPFAMPIAYSEMFKTFSEKHVGVVQFLSHGGLDYSV